MFLGERNYSCVFFAYLYQIHNHRAFFWSRKDGESFYAENDFLPHIYRSMDALTLLLNGTVKTCIFWVNFSFEGTKAMAMNVDLLMKDDSHHSSYTDTCISSLFLTSYFFILTTIGELYIFRGFKRLSAFSRPPGRFHGSVHTVM